MAEGATCSYIDPQSHESDFICPACQDEIRPDSIVQQSCACRLRACDLCLFSWADVRRRLDPPLPPSCFYCRQTLDLTSLRLDVPAEPVADQIDEQVSEADAQANSETIGQERIDRLGHFLLGYRVRTSQLLSGVSPERREALANGQTVFVDELTSQNTIYIDGEREGPERPVNEMILIGIDCEFSNANDGYFVWAYPDTPLGVVEKRLKIFAVWTRIFETTRTAWVNWAIHADDPTATVTWAINEQTFDRSELPLSSSLGQLGIVNGSRLRISYRDQNA